ncbi:VWA domain-containing protein [Nocardia sp. NPDC003963]
MSDEADAEDETYGLATLASALAGRTIRIVRLAPGEPTWTDGHTVHLDTARPRIHLRRSVALQCCLIAEGSLDPAVLRALGRNRARTARYLAIEGHRALFAGRALLPRDVPAVVDRDIAGMSDSAAASLTLARGHRPLPPAPAWFGEIRARAVLTARTVDRQRPLSAGVHRPRSREAGDPEHLADDAQADDDLPDVFTSPVGGGGPLGRLLRRMLGAAREPAGEGRPGAESAGYHGHHGRRSAGAVLSGQAAPADPPDPDHRNPVAPAYPEWDIHRLRYRDRWCTVVETEPEPAPRPWRSHWDRQSLRRPLARLGTAPTIVRRRPQGDDLDLDAVVESRVRFLSGSAPEEAVYLEPLRHRRDLSVLILLDISGSTAEPGGDGTPVHDHQRTTAAALVTGLYELGDRVALYAFRSRGRSAVEVVPVKRFDDISPTGVLHRLEGLTAGGYSRLGAAIRHGTSVLSTGGGTTRRLLLVLSDGLAYDHGYERAYGAADAHRALAEARRAGIGCLCLTIGASTGDADLAAVFGSAAHSTIPDTDRLATVVGPLFRTALATSYRK